MWNSCRSSSALAVFAAAMLSAASVFSADYPTKPIRIITGAVGTFQDAVTRQLGPRLNERWAQPVVVDNRPGAGMTIAATIAAQSPADGYTLLMADRTCIAAAPSLYKRLSYEPTKDLQPITLVAKAPLMLVAHPAVPASNVLEFIEYVRNSAAPVGYASAGPGSATHMTGELFRQLTGLDMMAINYKGGGTAALAIVRGEVKAGFGSIPNVLPHVRSGKLKAYVVTSTHRFAGAPDVPTAHEQGQPGLETQQWIGILAPAHTSHVITAKLNRDIVALLQTREIRSGLHALGAEPSPSTPAEFGAFIVEESLKLGKVIKFAGMRAD